LISIYHSIIRPPPTSTPFPYTTLFRSGHRRPCIHRQNGATAKCNQQECEPCDRCSAATAHKKGNMLEVVLGFAVLGLTKPEADRSEEHTSELQSLRHLVCRLLLEKKNR